MAYLPVSLTSLWDLFRVNTLTCESKKIEDKEQVIIIFFLFDTNMTMDEMKKSLYFYKLEQICII
jgi:hypothetical protein